MAIQFKPKAEKVEGVTVEQVEATVSAAKYSGKTQTYKEDFKEVLEEMVVTEKMANVGMKVGLRRNLGDYNSATIELTLYHPCTIDDIDDTYSKVKEWLDNKMMSLSKELDESV